MQIQAVKRTFVRFVWPIQVIIVRDMEMHIFALCLNNCSTRMPFFRLATPLFYPTSTFKGEKHPLSNDCVMCVV